MLFLILLIANILASSFSGNLATHDSEIQSLKNNAPHIDKKVLQLALNAYRKVDHQGRVKNPTLTVIDFSLPSNQQRMWIFDMKKDALIFKTWVAHGKNSGAGANTKRFSNAPDSKESSLGTYITQDTYIGHKGYSLHLQGIEPGFNTNAHARHVVVHGAWYVNPEFIKRQGRAGASWGCPAIPAPMAKPVINTIKNGSVIFAYYPDSNFLSHSSYI